MKEIKVKLVHHTPLDIVLNALSKPYRNDSVNVQLLSKIINVNKHLSVAEQIETHWDISGVSRSELQEHMRHRTASPLVESTRYTLHKNNMKNFQQFKKMFVIPEFLEKKISEDQYQKFLKVYEEQMENTFLNFLKMSELNIPNDYQKYCLIEGYRTNIAWKIDFKNLMNFIMLRDSDSAHFEIRYVAQCMINELKQTYIGELL